MKAISTVIASILMLMIVVGLGGTSYLFISGTLTGKTASIQLCVAYVINEL